MSVDTKLKELNIQLPEVATPAAAYVPYTISGNVVFISGQLPFAEGKLFRTGHLGRDVSLEDGQRTAAVCGLNILAHLKNACRGDLDRVKKILKLEILVAAAADFQNPHVVANGVSELMLGAFGEEIGSHARVAYGVASLPMNAAVEVAATIEIA